MFAHPGQLPWAPCLRLNLQVGARRSGRPHAGIRHALGRAPAHPTASPRQLRARCPLERHKLKLPGVERRGGCRRRRARAAAEVPLRCGTVGGEVAALRPGEPAPRPGAGPCGLAPVPGTPHRRRATAASCCARPWTSSSPCVRLRAARCAGQRRWRSGGGGGCRAVLSGVVRLSKMLACSRLVKRHCDRFSSSMRLPS
jgi:hypothetical protein